MTNDPDYIKESLRLLKNASFLDKEEAIYRSKAILLSMGFDEEISQNYAEKFVKEEENN